MTTALALNSAAPELLVRATYVNQTRNCRIAEDPGFVATGRTRRGELFRALRKEYGRCASLMYRDQPDGTSTVVGWVFVGRDAYQDSPDTYIREVWAEVATAAELEARRVRRVLATVRTEDLIAELARRQTDASLNAS